MKIQSVQFHDQVIQVLNHEGKPYVAMRSIVENIGLDWSSQHKRILRNKILKESVVMMTMENKANFERQVVCLPLGYLNGWLLGIDENKVKPEIRSILYLYKLECFDVLYNHFLPDAAKEYPNTIDTEQQYEIKNLVNEVSKKSGKSHQLVYTKLYSEFKIPRYQDLRISDFNNAIGFLSKMIDKPYSESDRRFYVSIQLKDNLFGDKPVKIEAIAHNTNAIVTNFAREMGYEIHSMSKVGDALQDQYKAVQ